jgi:hypothetical protein
MIKYLAVISLLSLAACSEDKPKIDPNAPVSNAEFKAWMRSLPATLKAPETNLRDRQRAVFHACLRATTAGHSITCRCNVRAYSKIYSEPELGNELDRAWMATARAFGGADKTEIAKVAGRLPAAPAYGEKQKALGELHAQCGAPEPLKQ